MRREGVPRTLEESPERGSGVKTQFQEFFSPGA
jgi:hypothetical protein